MQLRYIHWEDGSLKVWHGELVQQTCAKHLYLVSGWGRQLAVEYDPSLPEQLVMGVELHGWLAAVALTA